MHPRIDYPRVAPDAFNAMLALKAYVRRSGLEPSLLDLGKIRASQINGCAYCIHLHTREARSRGESEERLYLLNAWRESPFYTDKERAALAWTAAVALVSETSVPDDVFDDARRHLSEEELVKLTVAVGTINAWNRIAISMRAVHPVGAGAGRQSAGFAHHSNKISAVAG
ncbi:carboxymuconolactone decarboxylase family protein [Microvirga pakistanensis]|uniref:carboxymuconolactone decarboxylase family protein n=1 Tax=Microvirga pakistanensis TaxID=1682650 RepID=UPI00106D6B68|nr:carboxymuconolactone decarboxylase family protein [Microvirga pakistanensis]